MNEFPSMAKRTVVSVEVIPLNRRYLSTIAIEQTDGDKLNVYAVERREG